MKELLAGVGAATVVAALVALAGLLIYAWATWDDDVTNYDRHGEP